MIFEPICLLLALMAFVASLALAFRRRRDVAVAIRVLMLGIVLTNLVMALPLLPRIDDAATSALPGACAGITARDALRANPVRSFFYALQMGSLDADYSRLLESAWESRTPGYALFFTFLCVLSPLVLGGFIITLFEGATARIKYRVFRRFGDVFYFSELNERSVMLAESVAEHEPKTLVVFCNGEGSGENPLGARARRNGFVLLSEGERALVDSSRFRRYYFEIADDQDDNLSRTKELISLYAGGSSRRIETIKIFLFSEQEEAGLTLSSLDKKGLDVVLINRDRSVAYNLLLENTLYDALGEDGRELSVLLVGAGNVGSEILRACTWCGQLGPKYSLRVQVIDKDAERYRNRLRMECPELFQAEYDLSFHQADAETDSFSSVLDAHCRKANYIVVCLGNDELSIRTALYLRSYYLGHDPEFKNEPKISVLVTERTKSESIRSFTAIDRERLVKKGIAASSEKAQNYNLYPFGSYSSIYSYEFIVSSPVEALALNTHAAYEKMFGEGRFSEKDVRVGYTHNEGNRRSDRANAVHIGYKLFLLGYGLKKRSSATAAEVAASESLVGELSARLRDKDTIERLKELEHVRWNAFMRSEGWQGATVDEAAKYGAFTDGNHKFIRAKLHPCICSWDELDGVSERFDPKFKFYDEVFITEMPLVLGLVDECGINIAKVQYVLTKGALGRRGGV